MEKIFYKLMKKTILKKKIEKQKYETEQYRGEAEGKTFYLIYRKEKWEGLMSFVNNFLWFIVYGIKKGYIPVIDMLNYESSYRSEEGKNAYENYFYQPMGYRVEDIAKEDNVINNNGRPSPDSYLKKNTYIVKKKWRKAFQRYIKLNRNVQDSIEEEYNKIIKQQDVVLGINIRGTDYINLRCSGLPKQPEINEVIGKAKEWINTYRCNKVFLCCDSQETLDYVKEALGCCCVVSNPRLYYPQVLDGNKSNPQYSFNRENDSYLKGLEYLTSVVILSKCDYLMGGMSGAIVSAQMMRNPKKDFKKIYIWNLGKYE